MEKSFRLIMEWIAELQIPVKTLYSATIALNFKLTRIKFCNEYIPFLLVS